MFPYFGMAKYAGKFSEHTNLKNSKRKVTLSPPKFLQRVRDMGTFFFASLRGTLTVEMAVVLPIFLFCMIASLQYLNVLQTAVQFGNSMAETSQSMAVAAYVSKYGGNGNAEAGVVAGALSAAYAQGRITSQVSDTKSIKNTNMVLSSFLQGDDMIDLVLTYQIKSPISVIRLPGNFFLQRARVRAWTGRNTDNNGESSDTDEEHTMVYVTETGTVYHLDPDCTHLKLSIREVDSSAIKELRNNGGGKYHACEKCRPSLDGTVYITNEGDKYHNSLECGGLKRTVRQVEKEELDHMRACSKCGKG